ncbi:hypothetical protein AGOR_G00068530 [Albula goreensis]|uniref:THD domain-containing protein n=1 Tax=Albula goreensis TaxID=1534307 RepID=A0A8T3DTG9_9TELE|nr:hypothetical protein AGOR_G00068530 [Albula goreensis]
MINTYHTSLPPPPIPPRPGHHQPPSGRSTPFLWFLSVIMVLQMGVTFGGFIYLFRKTNMLQSEFLRRGYDDLVVLKRLQECHEGSLDSNSLLDCGKILEKYKAIMSKVSQVSGKGAVAHMVPERPGKSSQSTGKTLRWNKEHSLLVQVTYMSTPGALSINVPGDYYIYSQVTFSKTHPKAPLSQCIVQRKASMADEKVLLRTFVSLKGENQPSTSFQGVSSGWR